MQRFLQMIFPFAMLALVIIFFLVGIVVFAYLFLIAFVVITIVYIASAIQKKWFVSKKRTETKKPSGRIIDSDDWKQL